MAGLDLTQYKKQQVKGTKATKEAGVNWLSKDIQLFPNRLSDKKKEAFYLELSTMLTAGMDLRGVLELLVNEQKKAKDKELFQSIQHKVIQGSSFSEALKDSKHFTPYEYFSVQIGEETGKLPVVLQQLADFYSRKLKQKRQFINALSYPMVILFTSVAAVAFMLSFIIPMFSDVFKRFGGNLPYITQLIISFSNALLDNLWFICFGLIGLILGIVLLSKTEAFKKYGAIVLVNVPLFGRLVKGIYLARFCSSMSLLMAAKVPLLNATALVRQMVSFHPVSAPLADIEGQIMRGKSLNSSMSKYKIFDSRMIALLKVGEEVNQLDVFFGKLAQRYTDEVEQQTGLLNTFLEPFMIIFLGFIIGFILIAMYLPMFQLSTGIGG